MLSEHTGSSSFAYESGLPTLRDSSSASSSACASIASASLSSMWARSPGVVSSHSGRALFAACTARSTSSADARGTSAIVSPVAGFSTSIVPPPAASTHSPPIRFFRLSVVMLMRPPESEGSSLYRRQFPGLRRDGGPCRAAQQACIAGQSLRDPDRNDGQQDDGESDDVHDRELLALTQVVPDEDRERRLVSCREQ